MLEGKFPVPYEFICVIEWINEYFIEQWNIQSMTSKYTYNCEYKGENVYVYGGFLRFIRTKYLEQCQLFTDTIQT